MFLTLNDFLAYFPPIKISRADFTRQFMITYVNQPTLEQLFNLQSVIKTKEDMRYVNREQIIDYFYDLVIINRHKYLTGFYQSYFELPDPYSLKWEGVDIRISRQVDLTPIQRLA